VPPATTSAPSLYREKARSVTDIWYKIGAGSLSGYRVRETASSVYQLGEYANLGYRPARPGRVRSAPLTAYQLLTNNSMTAEVTNYATGDYLNVDRRSYVNGREHLRLFGGAYAGRWVGAAAVEILRWAAKSRALDRRGPGFGWRPNGDCADMSEFEGLPR
jgi:hypothetical protein